MSASRATVDLLRQKLTALEPTTASKEARVLSTGSTLLDGLLPSHGWRRGTLVEWLSPGPGTGVLPLALATAKSIWEQGTTVVIDRHREFYPPAAAAWGLPLARMILVRPTNEVDERWAWEQALLSPGVALVWGCLDRMNSRDFRRLQLAAEGGQGIGFLFRSAEMQGQPSWAHLQLLVRPRVQSHRDAWQLSLELTRGRGTAAGGRVELEINETGTVREVPPDERAFPVSLFSELAHPATCHFSA